MLQRTSLHTNLCTFTLISIKDKFLEFNQFVFLIPNYDMQWIINTTVFLHSILQSSFVSLSSSELLNHTVRWQGRPHYLFITENFTTSEDTDLTVLDAPFHNIMHLPILRTWFGATTHDSRGGQEIKVWLL